MKGLLISALTTAVIALGWTTIPVTQAKAYYSPPRCVYYHGYTFCLASYYSASCIYRNYYGRSYIYCRSY